MRNYATIKQSFENCQIEIDRLNRQIRKNEYDYEKLEVLLRYQNQLLDELEKTGIISCEDAIDQHLGVKDEIRFT